MAPDWKQQVERWEAKREREVAGGGSSVLTVTPGYAGCPKVKAPTAEDQAEIACGTDCERDYHGTSLQYIQFLLCTTSGISPVMMALDRMLQDLQMYNIGVLSISTLT